MVCVCKGDVYFFVRWELNLVINIVVIYMV
jgi:hypothetical protein